MDGVLADFEAAFLDVERRLFGEDVPPPPEHRGEQTMLERLARHRRLAGLKTSVPTA